MIDPQAFTRDLETWYAKHARVFPWRSSSDPYLVWISEIMSHQTQIQRVADHFYPRFVEKFPTIESLAKATWEDVFPVWEGLGYYQRGKNMLKTAQVVVAKHDGKFSSDPEVLVTLSGVGAYTAAAISSFAYDTKIPAIDTNIQKIVRVCWPDANIFDQAQILISHADSGKAWNSAMMDLASQLRSGKPVEAPLDKYFPEDVQKKFLPVKRTKTKKPRSLNKNLIAVGIACIHENGKYLIQTRPEGKSFVGCWEFPGGKREAGESFRECVKREIQEEIGVTVSVRPHFFEIEHKFGPKTLLLRFHRCQIQAGTPTPLEGQKLDWASPDKFDQINFLKTNREVLKKLKSMRF